MEHGVPADRVSEVRYTLDMTLPYNNLLATNGAHKQSFVWGNSLISASGNDNFYYLQDHLGSPIRLVGEDQSDTALAYDEFGVPLAGTGKDINQPFGFTGYQTDGVSGLYYAQARYYAPGLGRFSAEDIIHSDLNWYNYCYNNPVKYFDPLGLESYVYYDPDIFGEGTGKKFAESMKRDLDAKYGEGNAILVPTKTASGFTDSWNQMDDNGKIDTVVILAHSNPNVYDFDLSRNDIPDLNINAINNLDSQEIDRLILLGCNTAHSQVENNMAKAFESNNKVGIVIASDGTTTHYLDEKGIYHLSSISDEHWHQYASIVSDIVSNKATSGIESYLNIGFLKFASDLADAMGHKLTFNDLISCG